MFRLGRNGVGGFDLHARPHGGAHGDPLQIRAFGARRLGLDDGVHQGAEIFRQRLFGEARLADAGVDDARLLDAELDSAALGVLDRLGDIHGHRADFRIRHHAARTKDFAEPADDRHHVRRSDDFVEFDIAALHLLGEVFSADHVGAGLLRFLGFRAARENGDPDRTAGAVRQRAHAADHLVGVARIDAEIDRQLDGLIEFGGGVGLHGGDGFIDRIQLVAINARTSGGGALSHLRHRSYPVTSRPIERAEPSMILVA